MTFRAFIIGVVVVFLVVALPEAVGYLVKLLFSGYALVRDSFAWLIGAFALVLLYAIIYFLTMVGSIIKDAFGSDG